MAHNPERVVPKCGLTLVELLAVIAIIGLLVALLLPGVQAAREAARRSACANNIRQVGSALNQYHAAHSSLPIPWAGQGNYDPCDDLYQPYLSNLRNKSGATEGSVYTYIVAILPHLGQQQIYDRMNLAQAFSTATNLPLVQTVISTLVCPSDPDAADPIVPYRSNVADRRVLGLWYAGSAGPAATNGGELYCPANSSGWCWVGIGAKVVTCPGGGTRTVYYQLDGRNNFGLFGRRWIATQFDDVQDGLSNTVMLAETMPKLDITNAAYNAGHVPVVSLAAPINPAPVHPNASPFTGTYSNWWTIQLKSPRSMHPGGCHMAMADGSVAFLSDLTALEVICRLGHRKDGGLAAVP